MSTRSYRPSGRGASPSSAGSTMTVPVRRSAAVDDADTRHGVEVERAFLAELGSGCSLPVGGHVRERSSHGVPRRLRDGSVDRGRCRTHRYRRRHRNRPAGRAPSAGGAGVTGVLAGRRVIVTRERPGELASLLEARGATVVHVPLIEVVEPLDAGEALARELDRLDEFDWVVVTSPAGAERVGAAAVVARSVRLSPWSVRPRPMYSLPPQVERSTWCRRSSSSQTLLEELCEAALASTALPGRAGRSCRRHPGGGSASGRSRRQRGDRLPDGAAAPRPPQHRRACGRSAAGQRLGGARRGSTRSVTSRHPSSCRSGRRPSAVAEELGLKVTGTAADHSLDGLVIELERILSMRAGDDGESAGSRRCTGRWRATIRSDNPTK